MSRPFIVVSDGMETNTFDHLKNIKELDVYPKSSVDQEELNRFLPNISGMVVRSKTSITHQTLEKAPHLRYIIRAGEGTDNIDKLACAKKGIKVSNTPGTNSNSAAEHTIALMMSILRYTNHAHKSMSRGRWDKKLFVGLELFQKVIGIVGFGKIGTLVARRLSGFDPRVLFYDPFVMHSDLPYASQVSSMEEVFENSDIITIHIPLTKETRGIVNGELLKLMKPHSILINASRGGIVDEDALYQVLCDGKIRGAGLDVFSTEPLEEDSPLRELGNVVLTPHLGASTVEAQERAGKMVLHQLQEFFINNRCLNEVKI